MPAFPLTITTPPEAGGQRLDQYLAAQLSELVGSEVSRARVQQIIAKGEVLVDNTAAKASLRLRGTGDEKITVTKPPHAPPLRAIAEEIALDIVYEDDDLAIVNKPAGMMVHAGAGATDDARNRGTLVNALLHHFGTLSAVGGDLRPGIVHRLDRATSGLMVVAKNDESHRRLAKQFSAREVHKTYIALVHGWPKQDRGTIQSPISRHSQKRTRMTTRGFGGRDAVTHYVVQRKIDSPYGKFALVELKIETGRTHQIRVHMSSLGHPVVGDSLYGAPGELRSQSNKRRVAGMPAILALGRNFLHSATLELTHPRTKKALEISSPLPEELNALLASLEKQAVKVR
ncbi:MAG TPA: RluA family pseudouridine synthase [Terriglobales bacterium]|jgi:23S rRNA pseudouridine1911/1915/1917 synthase|nr:RluA family pseudouridine synthase [Terriglobales bacterium]